jgi:5-methylcytosine-specific restriction endonuclease McrA
MDPVRERILERDGYECRHCRSDRCLSVHHVNGDAHDNREENLVTLCGLCDMQAHRTLRARRKALEEALIGEGVAP